MLKKIGWFILVNIAFMLTITAIFFILYLLFPTQVSSMLSGVRSNANLGSIIMYSGIVGFISAFFTLLLSKWTAKTFMGVEIIDKNSQYGFIIDIVAKQAEQVGIKMPEVGIFYDHSMNAFATGATKNRALVAFSTGLLDRMSRDGIEAVSAHEIAHIKNGDMVTMTLIQGVVNTLVLTVSRLVANGVQKLTDSELAYHITYIVGQIVFGILALPISAYFSRIREFSADRDAAEMVGSHKMVIALQELAQDNGISTDNSILKDKKGYQAMCISGIEQKGSIFDTHPTLQSRIDSLQN